MRAAEVGRDRNGSRLTASNDVDVAVAVDVDVSREPEQPEEATRGRAGRGPAVAAALVVLVLVALALLPESAPSSEPVVSGPGTVGTWPARGELAQDERLLRDATAAWRSSAGGGLREPGREVEPLYLGRPDGQTVALLRSATPEGRTLVAAAAVEGDAWRLLESAAVDSDVAWLTLPGGEQPRVLLAPDVAAASSLWIRRSDGVWTRVASREDGVTFGLRSRDGVTVLGVVRGRGASRSLGDVATVSATSVLPLRPPVEAASPAWGRSAGLTAEEYDAALYASQALGQGRDRVAVLASTRVPGGRAVLVETRSPDDGQVRHQTVVPGPDGEPVLGPRPVVGTSLAAAVVPREGGRALVLAASAPSIARIEVRASEGVVVDGVGPTAVVLAPPVPDEVQVLGKRTDGEVVASLPDPLPVPIT